MAIFLICHYYTFCIELPVILTILLLGNKMQRTNIFHQVFYILLYLYCWDILVQANWCNSGRPLMEKKERAEQKSNPVLVAITFAGISSATNQHSTPTLPGQIIQNQKILTTLVYLIFL